MPKGGVDIGIFVVILHREDTVVDRSRVKMDYLKTVKWGFIGCGEVTEKKSGPAFALIEGSEVVAVMSRDKEKARSYAERHGIKKYYADAQSLVSPLPLTPHSPSWP